MIAFTLPEIPSKVQAAIYAIGVVMVVVAARRAAARWERLFAGSVAAYGIWVTYFASVRRTGLSDSSHALVFFIIMSAAFGLNVASTVKASNRPARLAAAGLLLLIGPIWWESLIEAGCRVFDRTHCLTWSPHVQIPVWFSFTMAVAGLMFLVQAARTVGGDVSFSRWILWGLASYWLLHTYVLLSRATLALSDGRATGLVELIGFGGAVAAGLRATREPTKAATVAFGAGIAVLAAPGVWYAFRTLIGP